MPDVVSIGLLYVWIDSFSFAHTALPMQHSRRLPHCPHLVLLLSDLSIPTHPITRYLTVLINDKTLDAMHKNQGKQYGML